jgi:hypothetical protein
LLLPAILNLKDTLGMAFLVALLFFVVAAIARTMRAV